MRVRIPGFRHSAPGSVASLRHTIETVHARSVVWLAVVAFLAHIPARVAVAQVSLPEPPPAQNATPSPDSIEQTRASPTTADTGDAALLAMIDGPAPPVPPAVISRDAAGRATIRAIKLAEPIRVDGQLDEDVYQTILPVTGFIQQSPSEGAPATEKTEAWVMFDDRNIYVSGRAWDSAPPAEWVSNEMRRDAFQLLQNDMFGVFFDTFYDRRNGFNFATNPLGGHGDSQFTNEGNPNTDWNPVWRVRTGRFHSGWTVEMDGNVYGFVMIGVEPGDHEREVGYILTKDAEGQGIAQEAARAARDYTFETLGFETMVSYINPKNTRSANVSQRLGGRRDAQAEAKPGNRMHIYRYPRPEAAI